MPNLLDVVQETLREPINQDFSVHFDMPDFNAIRREQTSKRRVNYEDTVEAYEKFYIDNFQELKKKYNGKFIVIRRRAVVDSCECTPEDFEKMFNRARKTYEDNIFVIEKVSDLAFRNRFDTEATLLRGE